MNLHTNAAVSHHDFDVGALCVAGYVIENLLR
ncbi:hypothetical protein MED222_06245 [Vibrio sp. MED222]|nr:hypothetical protein MED222_06245 [Vibrio sp. MED222]